MPKISGYSRLLSRPVCQATQPDLAGYPEMGSRGIPVETTNSGSATVLQSCMGLLDLLQPATHRRVVNTEVSGDLG
jgi:hypothetical protein